MAITTNSSTNVNAPRAKRSESERRAQTGTLVTGACIAGTRISVGFPDLLYSYRSPQSNDPVILLLCRFGRQPNFGDVGLLESVQHVNYLLIIHFGGTTDHNSGFRVGGFHGNEGRLELRDFDGLVV